MVKPELINWIKSEEAQGYSEIALTKILVKQNYSAREIKEAFKLLKENNELPVSLSFALLAGLGCISLILITIVLLIASFSTGIIIGYFLIILSGLGIGYYIYYLKQKLNATERWSVILGIFSPTLSLILIMGLLKTLQRVSERLSEFYSNGLQASGFVDMMTIFGSSMNPLIAAILFYVCCNVFVIISIIKNKEYAVFLWYLFALALFFVLWLVIDLFTSSMLRSTLA